MASGPITSWEVDGETVETVSDFIFLGSKSTVDGDCSHEIEWCLLLGRKAMNDKPRQCIEKQRHHFADKSPYSQSYGFSSSHVQMLELVHKEDWALKNWCFQILVLENTLDRVPWTARRSDQSILKEINPGYSLEGLMLKLILWLTCWKRPWCWERLKAKGEGGGRGWDG